MSEDNKKDFEMGEESEKTASSHVTVKEEQEGEENVRDDSAEDKDEELQDEESVEVEKKPQKFKVKHLVIAGILIVILAGGTAAGLEYYEYKKESAAKAAYTKILVNQAKERGYSLIDEAKLKSSIAKTIGENEKDIKFEEVQLSSYEKFGQRDRRGFDDDDFDDEDVLSQQNAQSVSPTTQGTQQNQQVTQQNVQYIYKVDFKANGVEYEALVNAADGKVITVKIDR